MTLTLYSVKQAPSENAVNRLCPYCQIRPTVSDDHIFSQFLGGRTTIRSCKKCNDLFGHRFEGPVSNDLSMIIVLLSTSGYKHHKVVTYKRAWKDEKTGIEWDLRSDGTAIPNQPYFVRDENGKIVRFFARSAKEARKQLDSLRAKGLAKDAIIVNRQEQLPLPSFTFGRLVLGEEIKRLAVKMCAALGQYFDGNVIAIDEQCRKFLLGEASSSSAVRIMHSRYPELDTLRPPIAHLVYIEANPISGKVVGVVQFFGGIIQFYIVLHNEYRGSGFAAIGILDISSMKEIFERVEPLNLDESPEFISVNDVSQHLARWGADFNSQIEQAFGRVGVYFDLQAKQIIPGMKITFPFLWIEPEIAVDVEFYLSPDYNADRDLAFPTNFLFWTFSADFGATQFQLANLLLPRLNNGEISQEPNRRHVYIPPEIFPGIRFLVDKDYWCPVDSLTIHYQVFRRAWLGKIELSNLDIEIDYSQGIAQFPYEQVRDVSLRRDPEWTEVGDPNAYQNKHGSTPVIEVWNITPDGFRLTYGEFKSYDAPKNG